MNKKRGFALVTVMIIMAVLAILGAALLDTSAAETRFTALQDRKMQAYYLAKSGVDTVSKYILENPANANALVNAPGSTDNSDLGNGTFKVDVAAVPSSNEIEVKGTGTVNETSNTSTLVMSKLSLNDILDKAIYTNDALDITNMQVSGDVQSGEAINARSTGANRFTGTIYDHSPRVIELIDPFPSPGSSDITINNGDSFDINVSNASNINDITINQHGVLNVKTNGGNLDLVVNNLNITGELDIDASLGGRVNIYVNHSMTITTDGLINNTDPKNLFIYLKDGSAFYIQANMVLNGYVLGPNATVDYQSNNSTINGAVYSDLIRKSGSSDAPNGAVNYVALPSDAYPDIALEYEIIRWEK